MKKIMILILLSILVCSCYEEKTVFTCTGDSMEKNTGESTNYEIVVKKKEIDPSTFVCLGYDYGKDKNAVYHRYSGEAENYDSSSFKVINEDYVKDKNGVYHRSDKIEGADPATFKGLNNGFGKDKNYVYFLGSKILGADSKTFKTSKVFSSYAKDENYVYLKDRIVEGVDSKTFVVYDYGEIKKIDEVGYDAEDKNNYYEDGKIVKKK